MNTILAISQSADGSINPELAEASPWLTEVANVSNGLMNSGIDPGLALATVAAVPVVLKILNMVGQFTSAIVFDWAEGRKIERQRQRMLLEEEQAHRARTGAAIPNPRDRHPSGRGIP